MESDEGFRLVLCFLGLVLYRLGNGSGSSSFGFLAAATHFTWVIRRTAVFGEGACRRSFNHRGGHFGNHRGFNFNHGRRLHNRRRLNHWSWLGDDFSNRCRCFFYHWGRRWRFNRCSRFGSPLEGGLFFANFTHRRGSFFGSRGLNRSFCYGFNHWLRLSSRCRFNGNHFGFWLCVANRCYFHFHFRNHWGFDRGGGFDSRGFNNWSFNHWGLGNGCFFYSRSFNRGGSAFSLLVSLGFSRCADDRAGNGSGNGQAGSQFGTCWFVGFVSRAFSVLAGLFRAFDHVAVGITLTLTTVAATTLATGAAAWTIAFGVVLAVFLQLLFAGQYFFFVTGSSSLLGAWLTLLTRWARLALFTGGALFTRLAGRTLFGGCSGGGNGRCSVQWLTQFTHAFFTLATRLAIFTRSTWGTWCALFTRCTFFTGYGRGFFTGFARCAFFTRCTFFARLALFVTATVAVTALLAAVATLFVTCRALGSWFFNHNRSRRLFLGGEQADQRLHQAFEQAWLMSDWRWSDRCCGFGRDRRVGAGGRGLDRCFLANEGAGRGSGLYFFHFGSGSGDFIAGLQAVGFRTVIAQTLNFEVRRFEVIVRQNDDAGTRAQFDLGDRIAFFVEQERGDRDHP